MDLHKPAVLRWTAAAALAGLLLISTGLAAAVHLTGHGHEPGQHHKCQTCLLLSSVKQGISPASSAPALLEPTPDSRAPVRAEAVPVVQLSGGEKSARAPPFPS
jgi:hypothetical protein